MRFNHRIAATAFKAVARTFGEAVRVVPMSESEHSAAAPDPLRRPVNSLAVVSLSPSVDDFEGARQGNKINTHSRLAAREASIWFAPINYAALGFCLKAGDRIIFTERKEEPPYSVVRAPVFSDRGDVAVYLVQEHG